MAVLRDSPIFVCGHPKSGTSLLRSILDSHPEIIVYPEETGFFRRYLPNSEGKSLEKKLELADRYLIHIFEWNQVHPPKHQEGFPDRDYSSIPFEEVRKELRNQVAQQYVHDGDMLSAAMAAFGVVTGHSTNITKYWLEKTPYNERFARQIYQWWPEARCIHVVRDPRDNFVSYRRKHPDWTASFFAQSWESSTRLGLRNVKEFGKDRYLLITYEEFVQKPEENLARLLSFLSIGDHEALRQPTREGKEWKGNSMWSDQFNQISAAPVGRWKDTLTPPEIAAIQGIAHYGMESIGYNQAVVNWKNTDIITRIQTSVQVIIKNLKETIKWL